MPWVHPDAAKFVPGAIWSDGYGQFEVLKERGTVGYKVRLLRNGNVVGETGWSSPTGPGWSCVKEAPKPEHGLLLLSAFVAAAEIVL